MGRKRMSGATVVISPAGYSSSSVTQVLFENFDSYTLPGSLGINANSPATVSIETVGAYSGKSLKGVYPQQTGVDQGTPYGSATIYQPSADGSSEVYIRLRAKLPTISVRHGFKFVKVFGYNPHDFDILAPTNYANCTFGMVYGTGDMTQVSFGDGSAVQNDTANVIQFDGSAPTAIGRSYGTAVVNTPMGVPWYATDWGTSWHLFELYVKFNSGTTAGNEVADGAFTVRIDGTTYVQATGLFNRHYSNGPIYRVAIFDYTAGSPATSGPFEVWYDNLELTRGGWGTQA